MDAATLAAVLRGVGAPDPAPWAAVLAPEMARCDITTRPRRGMFLANVLHETGGLKRFVEDLNYSTIGLRKTFGQHRITDAQCQALGRKPGERRLNAERQAAIANVIYGGAWGRKYLGNTQPADGWYFRGRSLMMLTGRANHTRMAKALKVDVVQLQALLDTPAGGAYSACQFWHNTGCSALADAGDLEEVRRRINGGSIGLEDVEHWYHRVDAALRDEGAAA